MKKYALFLGLLVLVLLTRTSFGEIPKLLNYQGYLTDASGNPVADDNYSLTFRLYASEGADTNAFLWKETQVVSVSKGVFNAILGLTTSLNLDFAQPYWLGIKVETNPELSLRVRLTSVGYAYRALRADTADYALSAPGGPSGNTWTFRITDTADTTITTGGRWGIARSGNTLYGNADSTHINLGVACTTGASGLNNKYCTVGGGLTNTASYPFATVGGGLSNQAIKNLATVGGGGYNTASGWYATVGGGYKNAASGEKATVGGGEADTASGMKATVGGGGGNHASGDWATIGGGGGNAASADYATAGGGFKNAAKGDRATVGGGEKDTASGGHATVGGGNTNTASGAGSTIGGGLLNVASGGLSTLGGGESNHTSGNWATIGGGESNTASGNWATVPGGCLDTAAGDYSFAAGYKVRVDSLADYAFAFGNNFTTSASHAVIFHDTNTPIKVGIGITQPKVRLDVGDMARIQGLNYPTYPATGKGLELAYNPANNTGLIQVYDRDARSWGILYLGDGDVGIGTGTPTEKLDVNGTARLRAMSSGTGTDVVVDDDGVLLKKSSSIRYKENIRRLNPAPHQILQLQPVRFNWKTTGEEDIGLIAEDVEAVIPDLVIYDKEGKPDAVKYDKVAIYLLEVVKAQQEQIELLKEKIEVLETDKR